MRNKPSFQKKQRFKKNPSVIIGTSLLLFFFFLACVGPLISPYKYFETHLALKNCPPCFLFPLGTDDLGRDILTRLCYGARISLFVGITAALIDLVIGVFYGSLSVLVNRNIDNLMMRFADILHSIPYLLLVIMLMVILGSGIIPIIIALTITGWIGMARIVRAEFLKIKNYEYVLASQAMGASSKHILFRHLIPNASGPIIVTMTLTIPTAIFAEAFLSFLGLGIQAPLASWGTMASEGLPAMRYYPWRLFFPALFISLTMLGFNLVGEGLRDALDTKEGSYVPA